MIKNEAHRLASAINRLRPEWSVERVFAVLGDERLRDRPLADMAVVMTAVAVDPASNGPVRVFGSGPWWDLLTPAARTSRYRTPNADDCGICNQPAWVCEATPGPVRDHRYEPWHETDARRADAAGSLPTPEQRDAMQQAGIEAERIYREQQEARENAKPREIPPVATTLAKHAQEVPDHDNGI